MLGVCLLFIGGVLVVNGVAMTGKIEPKDSAPFNLLVGILVFFANAVGLLRATENIDFFLAAGGFLFAFTYLYLSVVNWYSLPGASLGWYSLFVAINALIYTVLANDWRLAAMWLMWASLWLCFFLALALGKKLSFLPGYTVVVGVVSCWLPGALMLIGRW